MITVALRGLLARKVRLLLTAVAIALGVSFVTGTLVLGDTMTATFDKLYADLGEGTDVTVRARPAFTDPPRPPSPDTPARGANRPMPETMGAGFRRVRGVAAAEAGLTGYAVLL